MHILSGFRPGIASGATRAAGCAGALEYTLRVLAWAQQHRHLPTVQQIMSRWDVSRSTAHRYLSEFRAIRDGGGRLSRVVEFLALVEDGGLGAAELAAELGVHRSTAFKWRRAYLDFRSYHGRGRHAS